MNKTLTFGKHIDRVDMFYVNMQNKYHSRVYINVILPKTGEREDML